MPENFDRDLLRGSLDLVVLGVLAEGRTYGYLIQKRIGEVSGERMSLTAGTLYPLLHRLEDGKLIRSRWDESSSRRRKYYELTAAGRRRLSQQATEWNEFVECIRSLILPALEQAPSKA